MSDRIAAFVRLPEKSTLLKQNPEWFNLPNKDDVEPTPAPDTKEKDDERQEPASKESNSFEAAVRGQARAIERLQDKLSAMV